MPKRKIVFKNIAYRLILVPVLAAIIFFRLGSRDSQSYSVIYVDIPPPLETEAGERDLSQYDFGGSIGNCSVIYVAEGDEVAGEQCYEKLDQARRFIEEQFKNRRRGYVIIETADIDAIGTSYVFIEPTEGSGRWEVRIRRRVPGPYTRFHRNVNTWYYTEVFRRPIEEGDRPFKFGRSILVLRSRGVYELIL